MGGRGSSVHYSIGLKTIEPGSLLPVHRHKYTSETIVCLRGRVVEEFYDELDRICTEAIELTPNGPNVAINVPAGQWRTVRVLESGSKHNCIVGI